MLRRLALLPPLGLLLACSKGFSPQGGGPGPEAVAPDPVDTDRPEDTDVPGETAEPVVDDAPLFDGSRVLGLTLTLEEAALASLAAAPSTSVEGALRIDGSAPLQVGLRLGGQGAGFRGLEGKARWELDLGAVVEGQTLLGHRRFVLDGAPGDCSGLKASLGSLVARSVGLPAPRVGFATLRVNEADYGVYSFVEAVDDELLARAGMAGASVFDGQRQTLADGTVVVADFVTGLDAAFVPVAGPAADLSALSAVTLAVESSWATPEYYGTTAQVVDWPSVHAAWAVEEWLGAVGGYFQDRDHYYVITSPTLNRVSLLPGSVETAFLGDGLGGRDWLTPLGQLGVGCFQDGNCAYAQRVAVESLLLALEGQPLALELETRGALTRDLLVADPRRECAAEAIDPARAALAAWVGERALAVEARWHL